MMMIRLCEELSLDFDRYRRMAFWDSMRDWFIARGYTPYARKYNDGHPVECTCPCLLDASPQRPKFPYAYPADDEDPSLSYADDWKGLVVCAQDSEGRHVAMKLVVDGSEEYRILRFLLEHNPPSFDSFNHVIPVLDLLNIERHWLAVMPRWGINVTLPKFQTVGEILYLMHCLLKGLEFLHANKIAHSDISPGNILVNHFGANWTLDNLARRQFRSQGLLTYALFDFGCSTMFPPDASPEQCRLPYWNSWRGTPFFMPTDTQQGEPDYDPFAWDVGALGMFFCRYFQYITRNVPMLAPFLDKMVTWDVSQRFTAPEALRFFEDAYAQLTDDDLSAPPASEDDCRSTNHKEYDRWEKLDPAFVQRWSHYRIPALPWTVKLMRTLCHYEWSYRTIAWTRWILGSFRRRILNGSSLCFFSGLRSSQRIWKGVS